MVTAAVGGGQLGTVADKEAHDRERAAAARHDIGRCHSHRRGNDREWRHPRHSPCAADKEEEKEAVGRRRMRRRLDPPPPRGPDPLRSRHWDASVSVFLQFVFGFLFLCVDNVRTRTRK